MPVHPETIHDGGVGRLSMASPAIAQSFPDHHQGGATCSASRRLGHGRVYPDQFEFAGADAPRQRPVQSSSSLCIGQHLPASAFVAAPGPFIHAVKLTLGLVFHLPTHVLSELLCGRRVIHQSCLSCWPSLDGSKTIEKALTNAQKSFASGANADD